MKFTCNEAAYTFFLAPLQHYTSIDKIKTALDLATCATNHSELLTLGATFEEKYSHFPNKPTEANEADPVKVLTLISQVKYYVYHARFDRHLKGDIDHRKHPY